MPLDHGANTRELRPEGQGLQETFRNVPEVTDLGSD